MFLIKLIIVCNYKIGKQYKYNKVLVKLNFINKYKSNKQYWKLYNVHNMFLRGV